MADRLVVSSAKENTYYIHQEYSSNESLKLTQLILSGGYFGHAVIYKIETTEREATITIYSGRYFI